MKLDVRFEYALNVNNPLVYNASLVAVNPEVQPAEGKSVILPPYDLHSYSIGTTDTANYIFASHDAAAAFFYAAESVNVMNFMNNQVEGTPFDSVRLVKMDNGLTDRMGVSDSSTIALAAGATDSINATITVKNDAGEAIAAVHRVEVYISEAASGAGLTADSASGNLTASTGNVLTALTAKKHIIANTDANGVLVLNLVDSAKPVDQRFVLVLPNGKLVVSAASGANWGA